MSAAEDFDNDGDEDLFVTNLPREKSTLYVNQGNGRFPYDATGRPPDRPAAHTGFGTTFFDYDPDGWLDLFVANGAVFTVENQRGSPFPFQQRSQLYRNLGGRTFGGDQVRRRWRERPSDAERRSATSTTTVTSMSWCRMATVRHVCF